MSMKEKAITPITPLMIALRLTAICFVAVLLLIVVNLLTAKKIEDNKKKIEQKANKMLMPDGKKFNKKDFSFITDDLKESFYYYEVYNNFNHLIGYIAASIGNGYGGKMKVMVAFDTNLKILNSKLLDNLETPGLGKKAENEEYMNKFKGTNIDMKPFPKNKNILSSDDRDSVTGATITFNGIAQAITKAISMMERR